MFYVQRICCTIHTCDCTLGPVCMRVSFSNHSRDRPHCSPLSDILQPTRQAIALWMEAWNIYLAILIDYSPARASQLVAYQGIITFANNHYPLAAWLNYDVQFRTLVAPDHSLHWDVCHIDLWLQCVTSTPSPPIH